MVKTIEDKKKIVRSSINLIWEATVGEIKKIVFNNQLRSAAIFLSDGTEDTKNLNAPGDLDSDNLSQVDELMFNAQASENDTLNLEEGQHTEDNNVNNDFEETDKLLSDSHSSINVTVVNNEFESNEEIDALLPDSHSSINQAENNGELVESMFNDEEVDELLSDSHSPINVTVNTSQAVSIDNQISPDNECVTDNQHVDESMLNDHSNDQPNDQPSINVISGMLGQTTLAENSTLADDIESIQDNDY
ncbi:12601_t:CDS:2, partial [Racocetra fulgida]